MKKAGRITLLAAATMAAVALCVYWALEDPAASIYAPKCLFYHLTGLQCPGCGTQRAMHALLNGDIAGAWHQNALMVAAIPPVAVMTVASLRRKKNPDFYRKVNSMPVIVGCGMAIIAWFLIRNFMI